jgi:hypothetical protein
LAENPLSTYNPLTDNPLQIASFLQRFKFDVLGPALLPLAHVFSETLSLKVAKPAAAHPVFRTADAFVLVLVR